MEKNKRHELIAEYSNLSPEDQKGAKGQAILAKIGKGNKNERPGIIGGLPGSGLIRC